jgi:HupE / UreJ protein
VIRRVASVIALLWGALTLLASGPAAAHVDGTMGYATVSMQGGTVRYRLTLGIDALEALGSAIDLPPRQAYDALREIVARKVSIAADGIACVAVPGLVTPPSADRANVVVTIDFACRAGPHELTLRDTLSEAFGPGHHSLTSIEAPGGTQRFTLEGAQPEARVTFGPMAADVASGIPPSGGLLSFFRLGAEHILAGFDHLLFLLALLLRGGRFGSLLAIVTAFTLAHSISLALAVLDLWAPSAKIVEPLIALSIVYVAAENLLAERPATRRWAVSFVFGLAHGFGFAGALRVLELRRADLAGALLSFNLGVEAGQGLVIVLLLPLVLWLGRRGWGTRVLAGTSVLLLVAGLALLAERVLVAAG